MVDIDSNTVEILLAIIIPLGIAIAFIVRLEIRVKQLEKQIENNPIFIALKQFESNYLINIISDFIEKRLEKRNG